MDNPKSIKSNEEIIVIESNSISASTCGMGDLTSKANNIKATNMYSCNTEMEDSD